MYWQPLFRLYPYRPTEVLSLGLTQCFMKVRHNASLHPHTVLRYSLMKYFNRPYNSTFIDHYNIYHQGTRIYIVKLSKSNKSLVAFNLFYYFCTVISWIADNEMLALIRDLALFTKNGVYQRLLLNILKLRNFQYHPEGDYSGRLL